MPEKTPKVNAAATKISGEPIVKTTEATLIRSQPSVLIKNNGKGDKSYELKVSADTIDEAVEQAKKASQDLEKFLKG